jgi:tRNA-splicing ligase RtcB (3'-phosphate/5'-hydroxy nucleic acid ligase)
VATLRGITGAAVTMPDIHRGYGFPVGGVAATEPPDGIVSPDGVGYDINCGVRLLALPLTVGALGLASEPHTVEWLSERGGDPGGRGSSV